VTASALTASIPSCATLRSLEAYVVPHFVDVTAAARGAVTSILVEPRDAVRRGQTVAMLEPLGRRREPEHGAVPLTAPVTGLVIRRWASPGDVVGHASPVLSIASADDVLVVAKFPAGTSAWIERGSAAALLHPGARGPLPATIVTIVEAPEWGHEVDGCPARVVLSLPDPPADVLWPGTPVRVEIPW
jgi:hypothetical protein